MANSLSGQKHVLILELVVDMAKRLSAGQTTKRKLSDCKPQVAFVVLLCFIAVFVLLHLLLHLLFHFVDPLNAVYARLPGSSLRGVSVRGKEVNIMFRTHRF